MYLYRSSISIIVALACIVTPVFSSTCERNEVVFPPVRNLFYTDYKMHNRTYDEIDVSVGFTNQAYSRLLNGLFQQVIKLYLGYNRSVLTLASCQPTTVRATHLSDDDCEVSPDPYNSYQWPPPCSPVEPPPSFITTLSTVEYDENVYDAIPAEIHICHTIYIESEVLQSSASHSDIHIITSISELSDHMLIEQLIKSQTQVAADRQTVDNIYSAESSNISSIICDLVNMSSYCMDSSLYSTKSCQSLNNNSQCAIMFIGELDINISTVLYNLSEFNLVLIKVSGDVLNGLMTRTSVVKLFMTVIPHPALENSPSYTELRPQTTTHTYDGIYLCTHIKSYVWREMNNYEPDTIIVKLAQKIHLSKSEFSALVSNYSRSADIDDYICGWIREHHSLIQKWLPGNALNKTDLYLAGLFPLHVKSAWRLPNIIPAVEIALDKVNTDSLTLKDYNLNLIESDTGCDLLYTLRRFIEYREDSLKWPSIIGGLGPACSDTALQLAPLAEIYNFILISYSVDSLLLSSDEDEADPFPTFYRTRPQIDDYAEVYVAVFKYFNWKRVSMMSDGHTSDWAKYHDRVMDRFKENQIELASQEQLQRYTTAEDPEKTPSSIYIKHLETIVNANSKVIILDVYPRTARRVMCQARKMKMTLNEGYVWFLPSWLPWDWYDSEYWKDLDAVGCNRAELEEAVEKTFSLSHANIDKSKKLAKGNLTGLQFKNEYTKKVKSNTLMEKGTRFPSEYGSYAYDGVWAFVLALEKLRQENPAYIKYLHTHEVLRKYKFALDSLKFQGVSGLISFNEDGDRSGITDIRQYTGRQYNFLAWENVGDWTPNHGDREHPGKLTIDGSKIDWGAYNGKPGVPDEEIPNERPPCSWEGLRVGLDVDCETALIIPVVISAIVMVIILVTIITYIMKRRFQRKLASGLDRFNAMGVYDRYGKLRLDEWEIPRERIVLNRKLGEGAFGTVYGGEADIEGSGTNWMGVAVKTLKCGSSPDEKLDFLSEADVMKRFDHPNIIKLLGVTTRGEPVYAVMEFMLYGDLRTFLLSRRELVGCASPEAGDVSPQGLTRMCTDIIEGLIYLHSRDYVHRDIACRNCLISSAKIVKIGDFGMTRPVYDQGYYRLTKKGKLPVRWMAPESVLDYIFTSKSDIWSYGILLYEIITFGACPYQAFSNQEVLDWIKSGGTLALPDECTDELKSLLSSCWNGNPIGRLSAADILNTLKANPNIIQPLISTRAPMNIYIDEPARIPASPIKFLNKRQPSIIRQSSSIISIEVGGGRVRNPSEMSVIARRGKHKSSNSVLDVSAGDASHSFSPAQASLPSPTHSMEPRSAFTFTRTGTDDVFCCEFQAAMKDAAAHRFSYNDLQCICLLNKSGESPEFNPNPSHPLLSSETPL